MLTSIELHYKFWKLTQFSTFTEPGISPLYRTLNTKRWPQNYDVIVWWRSPKHAPHHPTVPRRRRCAFAASRIFPSSVAQTWYEREISALTANLCTKNCRWRRFTIAYMTRAVINLSPVTARSVSDWCVSKLSFVQVVVRLLACQ